MNDQRRIFVRVILLTVAVYFLILAMVIFIVQANNLKLFLPRSGFWLRTPSVLFWGILFLYYVVPFIFAFVVSFIYRNFRVCFFPITALIFGVHLLYSLFVGYVREDFIKHWKALPVNPIGVQFRDFSSGIIDENQDTLAEQVAFKGQLILANWPTGNYHLRLRARGAGSDKTDFIIGGQDFDVSAGQTEIPVEVMTDPAYFVGILPKGPSAVSAEIQRCFSPDNQANRLLLFSRWVAFFRRTDWEGWDPIIHIDIQDFATIDYIGQWTFDPAIVQRPQVVFLRYLGDAGRDNDSDGKFDEMVVSMEVDSIYEGPVYFQASIEGGNQFFQYKTSLQKGIVRLDFVLSGEELKRIGFNGPYRLREFAFINNDPYCPNLGKCKIENKPEFSVYLDDYETGPYLQEQFE